MKRKFPLFLIDRSKHSSYPFDYIYCDDSTVNFVARIVPFFDNTTFNEYLDKLKNDQNEFKSDFYRFNRSGGVVIVIEKFHADVDFTRNTNLSKVKTLLKKALKKYLHAEADRTPQANLSLDNQIKQQELTIEKARQDYAQLCERNHGDKTIADYQIALAEATLESLKKLMDNRQFISLS